MRAEEIPQSSRPRHSSTQRTSPSLPGRAGHLACAGGFTGKTISTHHLNAAWHAMVVVRANLDRQFGCICGALLWGVFLVRLFESGGPICMWVTCSGCSLDNWTWKKGALLLFQQLCRGPLGFQFQIQSVETSSLQDWAITGSLASPVWDNDCYDYLYYLQVNLVSPLTILVCIYIWIK